MRYIILIALLLPVAANARYDVKEAVAVCNKYFGGTSACDLAPNGDAVLKCYHGTYTIRKRGFGKKDPKIYNDTCKGK